MWRSRSPRSRRTPCRSCLAEDDIRDVRGQGVDALEVREHVEVDAGRVDRLAETFMEPADVRLAVLAFDDVDIRLVADDLFGERPILRRERRDGELEVLDDFPV